jgi:uncharacterized membrane protein
MLEFLGHCFSVLCGQSPEHTWAPGGLLLPCCQRCLGLYVGAGIAAGLHWRLRPKLSGRFLETHGMFLLLMVPCGLHWLPQNPVLRTISGVLFGFGVVSFLMVPLRARAPGASPPVRFGYGFALAATLALTPLLAAFGGAPAAYGLAGLALLGAAALALLVLANAGLALVQAFRLRRSNHGAIRPS